MGHPRPLTFEATDRGYELRLSVSRDPDTLKETPMLIMFDRINEIPEAYVLLDEDDLQHIHDWTKERLER